MILFGFPHTIFFTQARFIFKKIFTLISSKNKSVDKNLILFYIWFYFSLSLSFFFNKFFSLPSLQYKKFLLKFFMYICYI